MLKGKQMVMGLETYRKEAYTERHVKVEQKNKQTNKQTKNYDFLGNGITHARTSLRTHEFSLHT